MCVDTARALWASFCFRFVLFKFKLRRGAQDGHLDFHTAPVELLRCTERRGCL